MAAARWGPDPAIKLFGCTIPLPVSTGDGASAAAPEVATELADDVRSNRGIPCIPGKRLNVESSSFGSKNSNKNGIQAISSQHGKRETDPKSKEVKTEPDGSSQEKLLKKPDKILPCARCNSMQTKFCYFNNYNVNQPRHYCRTCKRYWTDGGTMRNIPVGSGRRKNKPPSYYHQATMSGDGDVSDATQLPSLPVKCHVLPVKCHVLPGPVKENERVTQWGSEVSVCISESPVLNTKGQNNTDLVSLASGDNKEEKSCGSSAVVSGCSENWMPENTTKKEPNDVSGYCNGVNESHPHSQSYPAGPGLVFPRSPGWNSVAVIASSQCSNEPIHGLENGELSPLSLRQLPPMVPAPGICAPVSGNTLPSPPPHNTICSGNNSLALGKHSREENSQGEEKTRNTLWVPKTRRITDEAAKSSIWSALGIEYDEEGVIKSFQPKVLKDGKTSESPQILQTNPSAFLRAQVFQERT